MKVKIRLSGGAWYDDDGLIWSGVLDELVPPGGSVVIKEGSKRAALSINNVSLEINDSVETYVLFVSPVIGVDADLAYFSSKNKRLLQESSNKDKT